MNPIRTRIDGIALMLRNTGYLCGRVLRTSPLFFATSAVMSLLAGLYPVVQSFFMSEIIDAINVRTSGDAWTNLMALLPYAIAVLAWTLLGVLTYRFQFGMNKVVTERIGCDMEREILRAMKTVDCARMDDPAFYDQLEQAKALVARKPTELLMNVFSLLIGLSTVIGYGAILGSLHVAYMPIILAASILLFVAHTRYDNQVMRQLFAMTPEKRRMAYAMELATKKENFEESKVYRTHSFLDALYLRSMRRQLEASGRLLRSNSILYMLAAIVAYIGTGIVYVSIIYQALLGRITLGNVAMSLTAALGLQSVVKDFISDAAALPASASLIDRYRSLVERPHDASDASGRAEVADQPHSIEFQDVTFRYPNEDRDILQRVSFRIAPGQIAAIVGENGAGKTTLIRLLLRLYDTYEGTIRIDGIDIRNRSEEEHLRQFGVMLQNFARYSLTVEQSVGLAKEEDIDAQRVRAALETANLTGEIDALKGGLQGEITKRFSHEGWEPSGGQWQRIGIARMIYRGAGIAILDEPSAALDAFAEAELYRTILTMRGTSTVLFISHRFTSIVDADTVLFIDSMGRLRQAPHERMMEENADYNRLYAAQAGRFTPA